jgi:hypothetical protein
MSEHNAKWTAQLIYRVSGGGVMGKVVEFGEIAELHGIVAGGHNVHTIERIEIGLHPASRVPGVVVEIDPLAA